MKRRGFIKTTAKGVAATTIGLTASGSFLSAFGRNNSLDKMVTATIPLPIQVVIDDVGWWSGKDGSAYNEPFRTGIARNHVIDDYKAVVELGKAFDIRPQAAMILCEWDRDNILRDVPHSNWMGKKWDNTKWVGSWLEEVADVINSNKEHFEISMHGLAHEWWENDIMSRAEWANSDTGVMRSEEIVERHIEAFGEILQQNGLGGMPTTFIPTNFSHTFGLNKGRSKSMAQMLKKHGVTYINTTFDYGFHNLEAVQYNLFGVDSGVLTVNRGNDVLDWHIISTIPEGKINKATSGMHWPNLLHINPERNPEIVDGWIKLLTPYNESPKSMLAKNSVQFQKQIVHHELTRINIRNNTIELDLIASNKVGTILKNDEVTIKIKSQKKLAFSSVDVKILSQTALIKDDKLLYTLNLKLINHNRAVINMEQA